MTNNTSMDKPNSRILRLADVQKTVGLSRSQIYTMVAQGNFPNPVKLGPRASGWLESEIQLWISQRTAERDTEQEFN